MRKIGGVFLVLLLALILSNFTVAIPQTDHFMMGYINLDGYYADQNDNFLVVSVVKGANMLTNFTLGASGNKRNSTTGYETFATYTPGATDQFVVRIAMDNNASLVKSGQQNDEVAVFVNGIAINEGNKTLGAPAAISNFNVTINDTTAPSAIADLTYVNLSTSNVNLSWTAPNDNIAVLNYSVYRSTSSVGIKAAGNLLGKTTNTYYADTVTVNSSTYYYVVTAHDYSANEADASNTVTKTTPDIVPPAPIIDVNASDTAGASGTVTLVWTQSAAADFDHYNVYYDEATITNVSAASVTNSNNISAVGTLTVNVTGLTDTTSYSFAVVAVDTSGNFNVTPVDPAPATPTDGLAPTAVAGLTVVDVPNNEGSLLISWTASVSADTVGYRIFRDDVLIRTNIGINNVTYTDTGRTDGTSYSYDVSPYDEIPNYGVNATAANASVDDLAPAIVTGAAITAGNATVNISWNNVTTNNDTTACTDLTGFILYTNKTGAWARLTNVTGTGTLYFEDTAVTNNVKYWYRVGAYDDDSNIGNLSAIVSATPSDMPILSALPSATVIKPTQSINVTAASSIGLDHVNYTIYNDTTVWTTVTNTSVGGATAYSIILDPAAWVEVIPYLIAVTALDTNGFDNQQNFTYRIDGTKPTVNNPQMNITPKLLQSDAWMHLNVSVSDNLFGTGTVLVLSGGTSTAITNTTGYFRLNVQPETLGCTTGVEGNCTLTFNATDQAGNYNDTTTLEFTIDDVAPRVTGIVVTGADNAVKSTTDFVVNVTVTDANFGSGTVLANGVTMASAGGTLYTVTTNGTALGCTTDGVCTITINATDDVANINVTETTTVTIDDTAPVFETITVNDTYVQNNTQVFIQVTVTDTNTIRNVTAEGVNLTRINATDYNGTITLINGSTNAVDVIAVDIAGNVAINSSVTYTIDDTAPAINNVVLSDSYVQNNTAVTVTVNVTDASILSVTAEGTALTRVNNGDNWTGQINLLNGASPVNVVALDNAANQATDNTVAFVIDDTTPVVNQIVISDGYVRPGQAIVVWVNLTEQNMSYVQSGNTPADRVNLTEIAHVGNIYIFNGSMTVSAGGGDSRVWLSGPDEAGNTFNDNTTLIYVDSLTPDIVVNTANDTVFTNADGNASLSWTIFEGNLSTANISVDGGVWTQSTTANGTQTTTLTGLSAGRHTAVFRSIDEAGNMGDPRNLVFKVNRAVNLSETENSLIAASGAGVLSDIIILDNATDISGNESIFVNKTLSMNFTVNSSGTDVAVEIPSFDGLDVNWNQTFTIDINITSTESESVGNNTGTNVTQIVLFSDMSDFLADDAYDTVALFFDQVLGDLDVIYIADDAGTETYSLAQCANNLAPASVTIPAEACFVNTTANTTLYLPHLSGGALVNDTLAPIVTINNPVNNTLLTNSYFTLNFTAKEANPAASFCVYNLTNGTGSYATAALAAGDAAAQTGTIYTFTVAFSALSNGNYDIRVNCSDLKNQSRLTVHNFSIADSVPPSAVSGGPTGEQSTTETQLDVTVYVDTDEAGTCRYSTTAGTAFVNMTDMDTTGTQNHTHVVSYTADDAAEAYYILCNDSAGNVMASSYNVTYSVAVTEAEGIIGGSSGGAAATDPQRAGMWTDIKAGETKRLNVNKEEIDVTYVSFSLIKEFNIAKIIVTLKSSAPSDAASFALKAYQYLDIQKVYFENSDIEKATIDFRVKKSWLAEQGMNKEQVALYRYDGSSWVMLDTTVLSDDDVYVYYSATATGFSYFMIGEKEEVVAPAPDVPAPDVPAPDVPPPTGDVVADDDTIEDEGSERGPIPSLVWWILICLAAVVLIGGLAYVEYHRHKKITHEHLKEHDVHEPSKDAKKLNDFIDKMVGEDKAVSVIRTSLIKAGWKENVVDDALEKKRKELEKKKDLKNQDKEEQEAMKKLDKYVKKSLSKDKSKKDIRVDLLKVGWDEKAVDEALKRN